MFELFYSWINSPVHHINSWMQLWVAANTEGRLMVGKNCLAMGWIDADAAVSPNVNVNQKKRNSA